MNSRQVALRILNKFESGLGNLDSAIEYHFNKERIDHRDRRFIFEMVYGTVRRRRTIDYIIDQFLSDELIAKNFEVRQILRLGVYQIIYMDKVPDHAAVNESVNIAKNDKNARNLSGVVNAILRNVIKTKNKITFPDPQKNLGERLSVEFSHPMWMIERWLERFGLAKTKRLLSFNNEKPAIYLRRKYRDVPRGQFEADVRQICELASGYLNLYYKLRKPLDPDELKLVQQGTCSIQAPSSGWAIALMDIEKGEHLLDLCAAPGGKTSLMSELVGESGTVCACDIHFDRAKKIVDTVHRLQLPNVYITLCDAGKTPFTGMFDKVLLDAPCSGSGVIQRHPDARWTRVPEEITKLSEQQKTLLSEAAHLVAAGGILVYSTCSLEKEENQDVVEFFLKQHPEFKLERAPSTVPDRFVDSRGFLSITPFEHEMDGMFAARLRKIG